MPDNVAVLTKRARAKFLTLPIATALAQLRTDKSQSYRNTIYCSGTLREDGGKLTGRYCGNRWCLVCNRIRAARSYSAYYPLLSAWPDTKDGRRFVTLTIPNVSEERLPGAIREMTHALKEISRAMRRTDKTPLVALRKLECTYNARRCDYHPHFHLLVRDRRAAVLLVARWLEWFPDAVRRAQDIRRSDDDALREMFKYFTKLLASARDKKRQLVPTVALDVIFRAMTGCRVYQPMGFRKPKGDDSETEKLDTIATLELKETRPERLWEWSQRRGNWEYQDTALTPYFPSERFRKLTENFSADEWAWQPEFKDWLNLATGELWYDSRRSAALLVAADGSQRWRAGFDMRPKPVTGVCLNVDFRRQLQLAALPRMKLPPRLAKLLEMPQVLPDGAESPKLGRQQITLW